MFQEKYIVKNCSARKKLRNAIFQNKSVDCNQDESISQQHHIYVLHRKAKILKNSRKELAYCFPSKLMSPLG